ncbi:MAG: site-specific integrase [Phycisphaeraceae bacterium]
MPARTQSTPRLCKDRDQAYVRINGRRIQCGRWGSRDARQRYDQVIAEWLTNDRQLSGSTAEQDPREVTVTAVMLAYWRHIKKRYTGETLANKKRAIKRVRELYGREPAESFGPRRLHIFRDKLVRMELARSTLNKQIETVRSAFRHAAAQEMIDARIYRRLLVLEPLRAEELKKDTRKVRPVPLRDVAQTRRELPRPLRALLKLQLLTGARPGELVGLRSVDIDTTGDIWTCRPTKHKTAHRGNERVIYFGPRAKRVLQEFMGPGLRPVNKPLFSPREAHAEVRRRGAAGRRRPNQKPTPTQRKQSWKNQHGGGEVDAPRRMGDAYDVDAYRRAIARACSKTGVPRWSPHQLRHNAATIIRRSFGIELARIILGHTSSAVTEIYAEADHSKAVEVMRKIG